jgi:predicted RNase H-like HicB family nuclease
MVIQWSPENDCYIVTLPEFDNALTHGDTYAEAARMGKDLIDSFRLWYRQDGKSLPPASIWEGPTPPARQPVDSAARPVRRRPAARTILRKPEDAIA